MQVIRTKKFIKLLQNILDYIAKDKLSAAIKFKKEVDEQIDYLTNFPYKCRFSYYYNNENIRDMIFKGYTIIYRISQEKQLIEILEIFNKNTPVNYEA